jgi:hypothetical protein
MRRLTNPIIWLLFIVCAIFFAGNAVSISAVKAEAVKASQPKATSSKITRMNATGKVVEVTDTLLKIERTVKRKDVITEVMSFKLEKPVQVTVGDKVYVSYIKKDDDLVAIRVTNVSKKRKQEGKTEKATEVKAVPVGTSVK